MTDHETVTPTYREAFWTWCRVALLSFGGPAGQIAVMNRIIVEEKKWISESRFLHALNFCMLLPGPEAQQLATYIGWMLHGTRGGLTAGILFILPGCLAILALSFLYVLCNGVTLVEGLFFGLKSAVLAIVIEAVIRIGKKVLKNKAMFAIAITAFVALFCFQVPFPLIVAAAGFIGLLGGLLQPKLFDVIGAGKGSGKSDKKSDSSSPANRDAASSTTSKTDTEVVIERRTLAQQLSRSLLICSIFLPLWFGPIWATRVYLGPQSVYEQEGLFFSKAAVVTFGGAYSVLSYVGQEGVDRYGWLQPGEMADGLGMAETTPGPLIMVVQFVGFMGAYRNPGPFSPLVGACLGSLITTWVTFVPCFFWVFLGAPYIEQLRNNRMLRSALSAITASVVGVVMNLAIWFAIHTLFRETTHYSLGVVSLELPTWPTINLAATFLSAIACVQTFYLKHNMFYTLATAVVLGIVCSFISTYSG